MKISLLRCSPKSVLKAISFVLLAAVCGASAQLTRQTNKAPVLISDSSSTRAIALESVTLKAEPFPLTSSVKFSNDTRTRVCIFAQNLELFAGEGANAFSADVQDAAGKLYGLKVEIFGWGPVFWKENDGCLFGWMTWEMLEMYCCVSNSPVCRAIESGLRLVMLAVVQPTIPGQYRLL